MKGAFERKKDFFSARKANVEFAVKRIEIVDKRYNFFTRFSSDVSCQDEDAKRKKKSFGKAMVFGKGGWINEDVYQTSKAFLNCILDGL